MERKSTRISLKTLFIICTLSITLFMGIEKFRLLEKKEYRELKSTAAMRMQNALNEIKKARIEKGIPVEKDDINSTGMIGPEFSPLVTTLGLLSAKRTATNPNFAALIVELFLKAGVKEGDVAAFGLSGSFPTLNIASLVAGEVLKLKLIVISSVGSSKWGSTHPDMTWLDMENTLYKKGIIKTRSVAASLTGGKNQNFLLPEGYELAKTAITRNNIPLIEETELPSHINRRLELYEKNSNGKPIKIFVNIGGPLVNLGKEESRRQIPTGLILNPLKTKNNLDEGIISIMLQRGIAVINLLNINGLAMKYGLPIDPVPLPAPIRL